MIAIADLDDFLALEPFFRIVEEALAGLADGAHFFDLLAEGVVFDYIITVPGYPRHVVGRTAVAELYRPYGELIVLNRCFDLAIHHDRDTGASYWSTPPKAAASKPGAGYSNRYVSVLTVTERKVNRWRDCLDPIAVFDAVGWPASRA